MKPMSWLFLLEAVVIVTVNVITIVVFSSTSRLRNKQYALIINLAIADMLVGLVSVPLQIVFDETQSLSPLFYLAHYLQDTIFGTASLFGLIALAIERAHAIFLPFRHHALSKRSYVVGIAVVWIMTIANGFALATITIDISYYITIKVSSAAISLAVICGAYLLIVIKVHCMATASHHVTYQGNRKLTVTFSIVTTISLCTLVPYQSIIAYFIFVRTLEDFWKLRSITKLLYYSNSLANFFVYAFRMRDFKTELIKRFRCRGRSQVTYTANVDFYLNSARAEIKSMGFLKATSIINKTLT